MCYNLAFKEERAFGEPLKGCMCLTAAATELEWEARPNLPPFPAKLLRLRRWCCPHTASGFNRLPPAFDHLHRICMDCIYQSSQSCIMEYLSGSTCTQCVWDSHCVHVSHTMAWLKKKKNIVNEPWQQCWELNVELEWIEMRDLVVKPGKIYPHPASGLAG